MLFLNKHTCTVPRALLLEDCPPDNVLHIPSDYPIYYDALHFPELHASVFESSNSFCTWLCTAVRIHQAGQYQCSCKSLMLPFRIHYIDGHFRVTFGKQSMCLSTAAVESSLFTVCWMLHRLTEVDESLGKCRDVLLNDNPSWCYRADADVSRLLQELPVTVLCASICHFQLHEPVNKLKKNDMVQVILRDFLFTRLALYELAYTDLVTMSSENLCAHRLCAMTHIISQRYGDSVAGALQKVQSIANTNSLCADSLTNIDFPIWMTASHHDMLFGMHRLPKKTVQSCLKQIPLYV